MGVMAEMRRVMTVALNHGPETMNKRPGRRGRKEGEPRGVQCARGDAAKA